jgi:hypothetical protein
MSLQDDYYDLDAELKGHQKRKMRRIWAAFCQAEADAEEASECVRLINVARRLLSDKPPLFLSRKKTKRPKP